MRKGRAKITIPGRPVPKARPRLSKSKKWYTPTRTVKYESDVCTIAKAAKVKLSPDKAYSFDIKLYHDCAKVVITEVGPYKKIMQGDVDNYAKSIIDGVGRLGGWDDRQVVEVTVTKEWE